MVIKQSRNGTACGQCAYHPFKRRSVQQTDKSIRGEETRKSHSVFDEPKPDASYSFDLGEPFGFPIPIFCEAERPSTELSAKTREIDCYDQV